MSLSPPLPSLSPDTVNIIDQISELAKQEVAVKQQLKTIRRKMNEAQSRLQQGAPAADCLIKVLGLPQDLAEWLRDRSYTLRFGFVETDYGSFPEIEIGKTKLCYQSGGPHGDGDRVVVECEYTGCDMRSKFQEVADALQSNRAFKQSESGEIFWHITSTRPGERTLAWWDKLVKLTEYGIAIALVWQHDRLRLHGLYQYQANITPSDLQQIISDDSRGDSNSSNSQKS